MSFRDLLIEQNKKLREEVNKERKQYVKEQNKLFDEGKFDELDINKSKSKKTPKKSKKVSPDEMYSDDLSYHDVIEKYVRPLNAKDKEEIEAVQKKMDKLEEAHNEFIKTNKWDTNKYHMAIPAVTSYKGKTIPVTKRNDVENAYLSTRENLTQAMRKAKFMPYYDYIKDKINYKYKQGYINNEDRDTLIRNSLYALGDEYAMTMKSLKNYKKYDEFIKSRGTHKDIKDEETESETDSESDEEEEAPLPKARGRPKKVVEEKPVIIKTPKTYKTGNIMKGRSDLIKMQTGKYAVEAEINLRKGLEPKVKRALKKAVDQELDTRMKGRSINLDYSSDSSSDEEDIKEYKKILKHLKSHVKDKKEKKDPRDIRDIKGIMKRLKSKSR